MERPLHNSLWMCCDYSVLAQMIRYKPSLLLELQNWKVSHHLLTNQNYSCWREERQGFVYCWWCEQLMNRQHSSRPKKWPGILRECVYVCVGQSHPAILWFQPHQEKDAACVQHLHYCHVRHVFPGCAVRISDLLRWGTLCHIVSPFSFLLHSFLNFLCDLVDVNRSAWDLHRVAFDVSS